MILNEQQRQIGKDNFLDALKLTRRELIPALVTLPSVTAFYWGYERMKGRPVRAALIGAGGQGRSHIDSINPEFDQAGGVLRHSAQPAEEGAHLARSRSTEPMRAISSWSRTTTGCSTATISRW